TQKTDLGGTERISAEAARIGAKIYLGFESGGPPTTDWWEYNPGTDTWTQKADTEVQNRNNAVMVEIGGKIYAGSGRYINTYLQDWWKYTP
ncbi:MAG: hypothetical protein L6406_23480, partial [Desulfobacterales bacterium]|nr:hypothetical protein [Desulfobacterales bacterium]